MFSFLKKKSATADPIKKLSTEELERVFGGNDSAEPSPTNSTRPPTSKPRTQ